MTLKSDKAVIEEEIKQLQLELLDDREWDFDLDGIRVHERNSIRYNFRKEYEEEFEKKYPHLVTKKYLTSEVIEADKLKYFKKSVSKPYLKFDA
jgi:hypothetical protein